MFTISRIKLAVITGTAAVALIAAGCSSDDSSTTGSSMPGMEHGTSAQPATRTDFNAADITFLQMMYPHHAQAVEMAKLVPSRSQNPQLRTLAQNVEQAQTPEMRQITSLLQAFGKDAPGATMGHEGMAGMMSADQMSALAKLSGPEFDRQWMRMMIEHHRGAIDMANTELSGGANADAKAMAQAIVTGQQAEITEMNTMLGQS
ncbi:DUF305 domain-containing protein [Nocardia acidivorans]|uniref:DUF305 domain-containing protein n=1 Tax=Nocardia acidivorans TaxID=404580 RepID=UPI000831112D|nr:DUF305 domain-containing protein [Nocardia acidivorans]